MLKNGYKIIFIKEGKFDLKQINLSPFHIALIFAVVIAFTSSLFFVFSDQFVQWAGSREIQKHRSNNKKLIEKINQNQERMDNLLKELELIKEQDDLFRKLVKLPPIHKDVRKLGVGGKSSKDHLEKINLWYDEIIQKNNDDIEWIVWLAKSHSFEKRLRSLLEGKKCTNSVFKGFILLNWKDLYCADEDDTNPRYIKVTTR